MKTWEAKQLKFIQILKWLLVNHFQSSRFVIIIHAIWLSFIGAIIKALWGSFPFEVFIGVLNGAIAVAYAVKTLEPGAQERRRKKEEG